MRPLPHILRAIRQGRLRRDNACAGKHAFSLAKAVRMARRRQEQVGGEWGWYECPFCGSWHLTSRR